MLVQQIHILYHQTSLHPTFAMTSNIRFRSQIQKVLESDPEGQHVSDYGQVDSYSEENKEVLASRVNSGERSFLGIYRVETGPGLGF